MTLYPLKIKNIRFDVAIADTPEAQAKGLSGLDYLGERKGMLFIFPQPMRVHMVMKDMNFGLDFLFLDENWTILQTASLNKNDKTGVPAMYNSAMVLELNQGVVEELNLRVGQKIEPFEHLDVQAKGVRKFKEGGSFELVGEKIYKVKIDDVKPEEDRLQVLDENGYVVANIDSGVTIFSREHTKELIDKFKKGDTNGLAESILKILDIHDNQEQDYVTN
jgi:hypothetical protein